MTSAYEAIYKIIRLWLGDPRTRLPKLLIVAALPFISTQWWQPIINDLAARHLGVDRAYLDATNEAASVSGWVLLSIGIAIYIYRVKSGSTDDEERAKLRI